MKLEKILFPTDISETADHAFKQAVALALTHQAKLHIFHAIVLHSEGNIHHLQSLLQDRLQGLETEAQGLLEKRVAELEGTALRVEISFARALSAYEAIADRAEQLKPDLIVMGTHGRSGVGKLLFGSVAEKVLRHSPCNVLTLRKDAAIAREKGGLQRVLVPVDFSDFSRRAVEAARTLVTDKAALTLVHVVASPIHPSFYAGGITELFQLDPELPSRIRAKLEEWLGDQPGEIVVTEGEPAVEILKTADETRAELIVIGTRGLSGLDHLLMGSVTERVVRTSKVPVLTTK